MGKAKQGHMGAARKALEHARTSVNAARATGECDDVVLCEIADSISAALDRVGAVLTPDDITISDTMDSHG